MSTVSGKFHLGINALGLEREIGDYVPVMIASSPPREPDDFGFDNQPTGMCPGFGFLFDIGKQRFRFSRDLGQLPNRAHEGLNPSFEGGVAGEGNR